MKTLTGAEIANLLAEWAPPEDPLVLVERILTDLGSTRDGNEWQCPNHEDVIHSFGIERGDVWPAVMHCFAGCTYADLLNALHIDSDMFNGKKIHRFNYYDADGMLSYLVKRTDQWGLDKDGEPTVYKKLQPSHVSRDGKITVGLPKTVRRLLFNTPAVLAAAWEGKHVWLVEGEKTAEIGTAYAAKAGAPFVFTTAHGGAGRLPTTTMLDTLANGDGAQVTIMRDLDPAGVRWALAWYDAIKARGLKVRIGRAATVDKGDDLYEHLAAGYKLSNVLWESPAALRSTLELDAGTPALDADAESGAVAHDARAANVWPHPNKPQLVADQFMQDRYLFKSEDDRFYSHLWHWNGIWCLFDPETQGWRFVSARWLYRELAVALRRAVYVSEDMHVDWDVNIRRLRDTEAMMMTVAMLEDDVELNSWIIADADLTDLQRDGTWINAKNGLVELTTRTVHPHTPEFFSIAQLPYAYEPMDRARRDAMLEPWFAFLASLWPGDNAAEIDLLQEWFGYVLGGENGLHKMLMLVGPTRAGKGVIEDVLTAMLGPENHTGVSLTQIGSQFGLGALIGKSLAVVGDMRFAGRLNEQNVAVERLLNITGGNEIAVDRKNREAWVGRLGARIMMVSNEQPELQESSGAFVERFLILRVTKSWLGREDHTLRERLCEPHLLGAILDWSLDGRDRLVAAEAFTKPASGEAERRELHALTNPTGEFARARLERSPNAWTSQARVFQAWRDWCAQNGVPEGFSASLTKRLRSGAFVGNRTQRQTRGQREWGFEGVRVRPERLET